MAVVSPLVVYNFLVSSYAIAVYIYGTRTLSSLPTSPDDYRTTTVIYGATHYTLIQINNALSKGYISQEEYDETLSYMV